MKPILLIGLSVLALISQADEVNYPRNNSYTAETTLAKESKNFKELTLASRDVPSDVQAWRDEPYKTLDYRTLTLDVFAQPDAQGQPLVVLVHGGGWSSGDKTMLHPLAIGLAKQGFVVASVSYRLAPEAPFPAGFDDVVDAVRWLQQHAAKFGADARFTAIGGTSAGAQLASLVAYSHGQLQGAAPSKNPPLQVQALLNLDGVVDFTSAEALPFENDPKREVTAASAWLGGRYEDKPEVWRQASPYYYVDKNAPPSLFLNSAKARFHAGRDATMAKLTQLGIFNKTFTIPDTPHTYWLFEQWLPQAVTRCSDFLQKVADKTP